MIPTPPCPPRDGARSAHDGPEPGSRAASAACLPRPARPGARRAFLLLAALFGVSTSARAWEVTPGSDDNLLRVVAAGVTSVEVASAPAWITCAAPFVTTDGTPEVHVPFAVGAVAPGATGLLVLRLSAGYHLVPLTAVACAAESQRGVTLAECCLLPADLPDGDAGGDPDDSPTPPDLSRPRLLGAQPNPLVDAAILAFVLPTAGAVTLRIYDVQGRTVREISTETLPPGTHQLSWNATGRDGREVPPGVYFCELRVGTWTETRKLEVLR